MKLYIIITAAILMVMGEDDGLFIGDFELDEETDAMII